MCRRHSPDVCVVLIIYKNLGRKFWWYDFIHVHALRDTSPKLKDFISYLFFPKRLPTKKNTKSEKNLSHHLLGPSSVHSPLIAPKPIWNTTLIMLEDIPTFTTRTTTILLCGGGGSKAGKWVLSRAEDGGYNQHTTAAPASTVVCSLWGSSSSSSHRPSPLRTILYTFHKSNFDRVFSIVYHK